MPSVPTEHYLKEELYQRIAVDPALVDFLEAGATDGLWYWDIEKPQQEWMSTRFKQLFGYEDHEIPNTSEWWQQHIHPDDLPIALENFRKHLDDPSHPYDQVVRFRHKDGSTVWVRCRGIAIRDETGRPVRMLGAHTDITSLKEAEARLLEREADLSRNVEHLRAANQELDAFAQVASHDLREPIRTLVSYSALLREDLGEDLSAEAASDLEYICEAAERMGRLVEDVLAFSRAGRDALQWEPVRLDDCLADVQHMLESLIDETSAKIESDVLPQVYGDRSLLTRLFFNLLANAIKFASEQSPLVRISASQSDSAWTIAVQDNGIGLKPEYARQIFEPFRRLHSRSEFEGSGLGLAIARKAVERHHGKIWVESRPGEGACFKLTLPAQTPY